MFQHLIKKLKLGRLKKINGENKYSDYLVSPPIIVPEVKKLPKPIIAPSTSTIRYNTYVSITSEPSATIFYKTIGFSELQINISISII